MIWPTLNSDDFLKEEFFDTLREEDALTKGTLEYLPFRTKTGLNQFINDFKAIIETYTTELTVLDEYMITTLKLNENASKDERKEIAKAAKNYKYL